MLTNPVDHSILESIRGRWSPYRFDPRTIEPEKLVRCFEAARWAASSFNDQPWNWMVATRDNVDEFERMISCLMKPNQDWARNAGALVLTVIRTSFAYNQKPNRVALHDLGQAAAHLALQATAEGLQVHQMGGVDLSKICEEYAIPEGHDPQTAIAIGYPDLSEPAGESAVGYRDRETGSRNRKLLSDQVFTGQWNNPAKFLLGSKSQ